LFLHVVGYSSARRVRKTELGPRCWQGLRLVRVGNYLVFGTGRHWRPDAMVERVRDCWVICKVHAAKGMGTSSRTCVGVLAAL
jgi:hypothetical protein